MIIWSPGLLWQIPCQHSQNSKIIQNITEKSNYHADNSQKKPAM
jgi:hypothetical protein